MELAGADHSPDETLMARAVVLGELGRLTSAPNPWVGCVIARDGEVVGEGFHRAAGEPHAEVHALSAAGERARGATLYVTLEPCIHQGRTLPCTEAVLTAGVQRVVVALADPDPRVAGAGIRRLQEAGVEVAVGPGAAAARKSLLPYLYHRRTRLAYPLLKAAVTLDGRTAAADATSRGISSSASQADAHRLRAESQAVLVGAGTALKDRPTLTVRGSKSPLTRQPMRVLLDARGRVPATGRLFDAKLAPTLVITTAAADPAATARWVNAGAEVAVVPPAPTGDGVDLPTTFALLGERGVLQVLVEGGSEVLGACLRGHHVQRLVLYQAPLSLSQAGYPLFAGLGPFTMAKALRWRLLAVRRIEDDVRLDYAPPWAWSGED